MNRTFAPLLVLALALSVGCASRQHMQKSQEEGMALRLDLAQVLMQKKAYGAAAPLLLRAVQEMPKSFPARLLFAVALREENQLAEAEKQFRVAARLQPRSAAVWAGLAITYDLQKEHELADRAHRRAIKLTRGKKADYWNNLGFSLMARGRNGDAIAAFERALLLEPAMSIARNNMGFAYGREGRYDDALAAFRRSVGEARAFVNLAVVYDESENSERAQWCRARAKKLDPRLGAK